MSAFSFFREFEHFLFLKTLFIGFFVETISVLNLKPRGVCGTVKIQKKKKKKDDFFTQSPPPGKRQKTRKEDNKTIARTKQ